MSDYQKKSQIMTKVQKTGLTEYAQFNPKKSKNILDQIDGLLSVVFKFEKEESSFIKNYAIEFRMGSEQEDYE